MIVSLESSQPKTVDRCLAYNRTQKATNQEAVDRRDFVAPKWMEVLVGRRGVC